jgi:hypothetical protein
MPDGRPGPAVSCWEVRGWIGDGTNLVEVSSMHAADIAAVGLTVTENARKLVSDATDMATDVASPLVGGQWVELGLLYDGTALTLYRDGRRISSYAVSMTTFAGGGDERVVVGWGRADVDPDGPGVHCPLLSGDGIAAVGALIDDVRLERLSNVLSTTLPGSMRPTGDTTITCHPDGRVNCAPSATITLASGEATPGGAVATLVVSASGSVSASFSGVQ